MTEEERKDLAGKLAELKERLAEREASMPAHSVRPHQLMEIEALEEEIEALERKLQ